MREASSRRARGSAVTGGVGAGAGVGVGVTLFVGLVMALTAGATPVWAHTGPVSSTPAGNSTVSSLPAAFSVAFGEALLGLSGTGSGFAIEVVDQSGRYFGDGCTAVAGSTISMGASLGAPGPYRMLWQVIGEDGHTVSGQLGFDWKPADASKTDAGSATAPDCNGTRAVPIAAKPDPGSSTSNPVESPLFVGSAVLAVITILGALVVVLIRLRHLDDDDPPGAEASDPPGDPAEPPISR